MNQRDLWLHIMMKCKVGDGDSFLNGFQVGPIVDMIASVWVDPSSITPYDTIWK